MAGASQCMCLFALFGITQAVVLQQRSESCECIGWQDAFKSHGADCSNMGDETCAKFFMQIPNEKFCLNENFGMPEPKQWCYVSPSCETGSALTWGPKKTGGKVVCTGGKCQTVWASESQAK